MNRSGTAIALKKADYEKLLSPYLQEGRKRESWRIDQVVIDDKRLTAMVSMRSTYVSGTDRHGFHLTIFSTLEFLSQLMIIFTHTWAGLAAKTREAWMLESTTRSRRAIRDPEAIRVEMNVRSIRRRGENIYCVADFQVTDKLGGLFEVELKGFV
jgi:hypothetical protein